MSRCVYQDHPGHYCGELVSEDDLESVELENGAGIICGKHVEILLTPRTPKDDPLEAWGNRHGGGKRKATVKGMFATSLSDMRVKKLAK